MGRHHKGYIPEVPPFEKGDRVKVIGRHLATYGFTGTVLRYFRGVTRARLCTVDLDIKDRQKRMINNLHTGTLILACNLEKIRKG